MSTRWRYYKSKTGKNRFRGRGRFIGRGRGKGTSLTVYHLPREDISNNMVHFKDKAMNPKECIDETVLSLSFGQNMLGGAYYEQSTQLVKTMNDISDDHEFKYLMRLIEEANPTMILVNKSQDLDFIKWLSARYEEENLLKRSGDATDTTTESIPTWDPALAYDEYEESEENVDDEEIFAGPRAKLFKLPNSFSKMPRALDRLKKMLESDDVSVSDEDKRTFVTMRFDIDAVHMLRSLGALLLFLDEIRLGVEQEPLGVRSPIKSIKSVTLANLVDIDFNTIRALDILPKETESKRTAGQHRSLYGLADRCRSTVGKKCLQKWFRNPTTDRDELISRQKCVHFFKQDSNAEVNAKVSQALGKVKPLNNIFLRFQNGSAQLLHWESFVSTINALVEVMNIIKQTNIAGELYVENSLITEISEIAIITSSIINFAESKIQGRVTVMPGIDADLDEIRDAYENMPLVLTAVAKQEAVRLGIMQSSQVTCLYVPLVGFILSLPRDFPTERHTDMSLVYVTSDEQRVRNSTTERLEEEYGDILMKLIDKQTVIILKLKGCVMKRKRGINKLLTVVARIDALVSLGLTAAENGWNCPTLLDDPIIEASEMFHPMSALVVKKHPVPNPVCSGRNGVKLSVITGPNACGKSVYMKSVGILVFLTHIGSFVPARHAKVGMVDRIVTRMFTVDSVLDGLSTFAKDVEQVALALRRATVRSLVIIDEFGKGTMTEVGLSLLASCLNHWMGKGFQGCPHIFLASHFHALPQYLMSETDMVSFLTFKVLREPRGKVKYLFQLVPGMVDCSFALSVAKEEGIPMNILGRAARIYQALKSGTLIREVRSEVTNVDDGQLIADMEVVLSNKESFLDDVESFVHREKRGAARKASTVKETEIESAREGSGSSVLKRNENQKRMRSISTLSKVTVTDQLSLLDALLPSSRKKPRVSETKTFDEERQASTSTTFRTESPDLFADDDGEEEEEEEAVNEVSRLGKESQTSSKKNCLEVVAQKKYEDRLGVKRPISPSASESVRKRPMASEENLFETPKQPARHSSLRRFAPPQYPLKPPMESQFKTPMNIARVPQYSSANNLRSSQFSLTNEELSRSTKRSDDSVHRLSTEKSSQYSRIESQKGDQYDSELTERSSLRREMREEDSQFKFRSSPIRTPNGTQFSFLNQTTPIAPSLNKNKYSFGVQVSLSTPSDPKSNPTPKSSNPFDFVFKTPTQASLNSEKTRPFLFQKAQMSRQTISPSSVILEELFRGASLQTPLPRGDRVGEDDYNPLIGNKSSTSQKSDDEDEEFLRSFFESEKSLKIASSSESSMSKTIRK